MSELVADSAAQAGVPGAHRHNLIHLLICGQWLALDPKSQMCILMKQRL